MTDSDHTLEFKSLEHSMTSKSHKDDKCIEKAGNLSSYVITNTLTVCITYQLDVLSKLPGGK